MGYNFTTLGILKTKDKWWPVRKEHQQHMKMRKKQNLVICKFNWNENWMAKRLKRTDLKWTRQAQWGWRLFDFWNHELGIAVEVDGPEHETVKDAERDAHFYKKSGIVVLRVRNRNEVDADHVLEQISKSETWSERRLKMGLTSIRSRYAKPMMPRQFEHVDAMLGHQALDMEFKQIVGV